MGCVAWKHCGLHTVLKVVTPPSMSKKKVCRVLLNRDGSSGLSAHGWLRAFLSHCW